MSNAACKAVICEDKAMSLMEGACNSISAFQNEKPKFRIAAAEIYIKAMEQATKEVIKLTE